MASDDESLSPQSGLDGDGSEDSEVESNAMPLSMVQTPATDLTSQQLRELLKATQLNHQSLADKYKALKIDHDESAVSRKPARAAKQSAVTGESKEISLAGGRFSVVGELWVSNITLDLPFPQDVDPLKPGRYSNARSEARGVIAELYLDLMPHLRDALADGDRRPTFKTIFLKQLSQERSNSAHTVRTYAGRLLGLKDTDFTKSSDHTHTPALRKLLEDPEKPAELYPLWPPLLFPEHDVSCLRPFQREPLTMFLKIILFGASSLKSEGIQVRKRPTKGVLWSVEKTTPGMIAMAATLLTFACSPDQSFLDTAKGPSGVNWKLRFKLYKQAIICFPPTYCSDLLNWYDESIFGIAKTVLPSGSGSLVPGLGDVEDLVARLHQAEAARVSKSPAPPPLDSLPVQLAPVASLATEPDLGPPTHSPSCSADGTPAPGQIGQLEEPAENQEENMAQSTQPRVTRNINKSKGKAKRARK